MTKADREFQEAVRDLGCCVCILTGLGATPCEIHHCLSGGRRIDEKHVLGLCPPHHRGGRNDAEVVSRHPWRAAFVERYGSEAFLLKRTRELVQVPA